MSEENQTLAVELAAVTRNFEEAGRQLSVLRDLDFAVQTGEIVALKGRSGSGKSTLLNVIAGIDQPDSGTVTVSQSCLSDMTERERTLFRREHIGFVYQAFNLVPTLTVADNVRLVLELNDWGRNESNARVETLLSAVELLDRASSYPDVLSGGEQQRVAVARALAHRPSLIVADEPTGNLDDAAAAQVLALMMDLVGKENATLVVATHSNAVAAMADRISVLKDRRIV